MSAPFEAAVTGPGPAPRVVAMTGPSAGGPVELLPAPNDSPEAWRSRFLAAFGTTELAVAEALFQQLLNALCPGQALDAATANLALALLHRIAPNDELEAMLACQMIVAHVAVMDATRRALHLEQTPGGRQAYLSLARKLMMLFTAQMDTLNRKSRQGDGPEGRRRACSCRRGRQSHRRRRSSDQVRKMTAQCDLHAQPLPHPNPVRRYGEDIAAVANFAQDALTAVSWLGNTARMSKSFGATPTSAPSAQVDTHRGAGRVCLCSQSGWRNDGWCGRRQPTARLSSRRPNSACCWKASIGGCCGGPGGRSWLTDAAVVERTSRFEPMRQNQLN